MQRLSLLAVCWLLSEGISLVVELGLQGAWGSVAMTRESGRCSPRLQSTGSVTVSLRLGSTDLVVVALGLSCSPHVGSS